MYACVCVSVCMLISIYLYIYLMFPYIINRVEIIFAHNSQLN